MFNFLQTRPSSPSTTLAKSALDGLRKHNSGWGLEHNSFDERGGPVLFGYSCDLPRISRYADTPEKREMKDTLICFDFQTLALERLCAGKVVFQWPGSSAVKEEIFDQHCSTSMSFVFLVINCSGRNREINPRSSRLVFILPQEQDRHMTTPIDAHSRALHRLRAPPLQVLPPRQPSRTSSNSVPAAFDTHVLTA